MLSRVVTGTGLVSAFTLAARCGVVFPPQATAPRSIGTASGPAYMQLSLAGAAPM